MMTHTDSHFDADDTAETFNPFPGLRPFETDEYTLFFGREGQSDELLARLGRTRFLAVVGTSGSGKSSLIRAGLLPALHGGLMAGAGSAWRVALLRPGGDPIGNLSAALCSEEALGAGEGDAEVRAAIVEATLRRSTLGLVDVVRQARLKPYENLLVVVDQFEELFRFRSSMEAQGSEDDAAAFVKLLLEAPQQKAREELAERRKQSPDYEPPPGQEVLPVYVVLTMRSDFLGDCAQFQGLPEAINDGQYLIPRMTRDERRAAITGPAAVGGGEISLPLVNRLLNDVGDNPDQLPILQHALMRTWEHWAARCANGDGASCAAVELSDYEAVGGMADALSRHADEAFNELRDEGSRLVAEKMFKALTEKGADNREIRRPATLRELCEIAEATPEEVVSVVETFRREGRSFLMPPVGTPLTTETVIDISHESLIRNWERLKKWVDEEAQSARIYRRLAEAATLHGAGQESLAAGAGLQVALDWREKARPNAAWASRYHPAYEEAMEFLEESKAAHEAAVAERERQREEQLARERRELEQAHALAEQQALSLKQAEALAEEQRKFAEQQALSLEQAQRFAEEQKRFAEQQALSARRARRLTFAMVFLALVALGTAGLALKARSDAVRNRVAAERSREDAKNSEAAARTAQKQAEEANKSLYESLVKQNEATQEADRERKAAEESEKKAVAEQQKAEAEKMRANEQARIAAEREQDALRASEQQRIAAEAARVAKEKALAAEAVAKSQNERLMVDQLGRLGLDSFQRGNYGGAEYAFQMALGMIGDKAVGKDGEVKDRNLAKSQAWVLANIGSAQRKLGNYDKAIKSYQKSLEIHEKVSSEASGEKFDAVHGLGHAYNDADDEYNANQFYTRAVEMLVSKPDLIDQLYELPNKELIARLYRDLGRFKEAEPHFKRVLELRRERNNKNELAETLREVAQFYALQNRWGEAEKHFLSLLEIQEAPFAAGDLANVDFRALADSYGELAETYIGMGEEPKAKTVFQLARVIQDFVLKQKQVMAAVVSSAGEDAMAERIKALKLERDFAEIGDLYVRLGKFRPAEAAYNEVIKPDVSDPEFRAETMLKLGSLYRYHFKDYDKASETYRAAVAAVSGRGASPLLLGEAMTQLGSLYAEELNMPELAAALLTQALVNMSRLPGSERARFETLDVLARSYRKQLSTDEIVNVSRRKLELAQELLARNLPNTPEQKAWDADAYAEAFGLVVRAVGDLSEALHAQGDAKAAKAVYEVLLEEELDVNQVVDEKVVDAYLKALEANAEYLRTLGSLPSATRNVTQVIASARAKRTQIEQITRSQQARQQAQQTYTPAATPR